MKTSTARHTLISFIEIPISCILDLEVSGEAIVLKVFERA